MVLTRILTSLPKAHSKINVSQSIRKPSQAFVTIFIFRLFNSGTTWAEAFQKERSYTIRLIQIYRSLVDRNLLDYVEFVVDILESKAQPKVPFLQTIREERFEYKVKRSEKEGSASSVKEEKTQGQVLL